VPRHIYASALSRDQGTWNRRPSGQTRPFDAFLITAAVGAAAYGLVLAALSLLA
jgi:hypothetical protein